VSERRILTPSSDLLAADARHAGEPIAIAAYRARIVAIDRASPRGWWRSRSAIFDTAPARERLTREDGVRGSLSTATRRTVR
jgi:hypothetical protein